MDWKQIDWMTIVVVIMIAERIFNFVKRIKSDHTPPCAALVELKADLMGFKQDTSKVLMEIHGSVKYMEGRMRNGGDKS